MKIKDIFLKEIFDSRGESTIEVGLKSESGAFFRAQIPSGKSRGKREAAVLSYPAAGEVLEKIVKPALVGRDFNSIKNFDDFLLALDGTPQKEKLGGNLILGLSLAFARALGASRHQELWQAIQNEFFPETKESILPRIFANLINGGQHAKSNLAIQEYMVITAGQNASETFQQLENFYKNLGEVLKEERGLAEIPLGDEGGYVLDWPDNFAPLAVLDKQLALAGLDKQGWFLGIDAAASSFWQDNVYKFEDKRLSAVELKEVYLNYFRRSPLFRSIEDPFNEDDGQSFGDLNSAVSQDRLVVGDDLTVTNPALIKSAAEKNLINAVIIKPNQIGSVSEAGEAIKIAHAAGAKCVISHRSGETDDFFLVHFAKAANAFGVKIGAPVRERVLKYQELIRLYD